MSSEVEQLTMTEEVTGESTAKQPLLIETVMDCLFSHLDFPALKKARIVCKTWKETARRHILERGAIRFDEDVVNGCTSAKTDAGESGILDLDTDTDNMTKKMKQLSLLDNMGSLGLEEDGQRFKNYILTKALWKNSPSCPIQNYFVNFGHHVKSMKFQRARFLPIAGQLFAFEHTDFTLEFFVKILETCPNLEELEAIALGNEFDSFDVEQADQVLELTKLGEKQELKLKSLTFLVEGGIHQSILHIFFRVFPLLTNFSIINRFLPGNDYQLVQNLFELDPTSMRINMNRLCRLDISTVRFVATTEALWAMCEQPLPNLTYLRIAVSNDMEEMAFNALLEHLNGSLRYFGLTHATRNGLLGFSPRIPATMIRLEYLEVTTVCNQLLMGVLESAVNLPSLKRLILHREAIHETIGYLTPGAQYDFTECWTSLPVSWVASRQESVKTLELPCGLTQADHLLQVLAVFSAVRDLRLKNPTPEVIRAVFTVGTTLERLSLRLLTFPKKINSILTGLRPKICSTMVKEGKYSFKDPKQVTDWGPGLRDMRNLQYFELRQWYQSSWLTEASLWQGLMYLTRAYRLDLGLGPSHRLSEPSLAALQSTLGPYCFINIDTRTRHPPPPMKETPETQHCYCEFWSRDMTKSGKWKACSGPCCQVYE